MRGYITISSQNKSEGKSKTRGNVRDLKPKALSRDILRKNTLISQARLASAMQSAPDAVLCLELSGQIMSFNIAAREMFGLQVYGSTSSFLSEFIVNPDQRRSIDAWLLSARAVNKHATSYERRHSLTLDLTGSDTTPFPAEMHLVQSRTGELTAFVRDLSNDVSHMNEIESAYLELKHKSDLKARFLAAMSHEIRTPFNAVSGLLDILSETELDDEQCALVSTGQEATAALLQITDDILDYTKITAGKLLLVQSPFKAREVFGTIFRLFEPVAKSKGLNLILDVKDVEDVTLIGDLPRLQQILMNFVSNAVKFTDAGQIILWASTRDLANGASELTCVVKDTGIGISMDAQSHLFGEFYRVEDGQEQVHTGTGLGLAISKILVRMMDGLIGVRSGTGQGSNFWVSVPFKLGTAADIAANCETKLASQKRMKSMGLEDDIAGVKILLADDNKTNQMILTRHLENLGAHVTVVDNGAEALQVLEAAPFDIALMDISMPVMDGVTATQHIRASDAPYGTLPVLALTAIATEGQRQQYMEAGMSAVLTKPVNPSDLKRVISDTLRQTKKERQVSRLKSEGLAVFERHILDSILTGLGQADIFALSQQVSKDLISCVSDLEQAIISKDMEAIQRYSHILKGLSATFGCLNLSEVAELTNYNAIKGSIDDAVENGSRSILVGRDAINQVEQVFTCYVKVA